MGYHQCVYNLWSSSEGLTNLKEIVVGENTPVNVLCMLYPALHYKLLLSFSTRLMFGDKVLNFHKHLVYCCLSFNRSNIWWRLRIKTELHCVQLRSTIFGPIWQALYRWSNALQSYGPVPWRNRTKPNKWEMAILRTINRVPNKVRRSGNMIYMVATVANVH